MSESNERKTKNKSRILFLLRYLYEYTDDEHSISTNDLISVLADNGKIFLITDNWQKYLENGEYLRSAEMADEQNYNMIDGVGDNRATSMKGQAKAASKEETEPVLSPDGRISVLQRLKDKQAIVNARYGKAAPEQEKDDMQRSRK